MTVGEVDWNAAWQASSEDRKQICLDAIKTRQLAPGNAAEVLGAGEQGAERRGKKS